VSTSRFQGMAEFEAFLASLGGEVSGLRYDLEVAARVVPHLSPHRFAPAVVVGGTNGKGSVCWWLARALQNAGYRVGLYTSPHLLDLRERIRLNGEPVSESCFLAAANRAWEAVEALAAGLPRRPTWFEWLTFTAAACFDDLKPDVHVLEVGLGGRLDAVNTANPALAVITTVGLDHCQVLGPNVMDIAREKLGILRPGAPLVIGPQAEWAAPWGGEIAARCTRLVTARLEDLDALLVGGCPSTGESGSKLGLAGGFQRFNASSVVAAAREMARLGWRLTDEAVRDALRQGGWPGRLQRISAEPEIWVDGAHNVPAMEALAAEFAAAGRQPVVVFGAMRDKDIPGLLRVLAPAAQAVVLTRAPGDRAAGAEILEPLARQYAAIYLESPAEALRYAVEFSGGRTPVLVTGSLYLAAEILRLGDGRGGRAVLNG